MEGIEFEKETYARPLYAQQQAPKKSWAIRLVMKLSLGRIKTDEQAGYVLIGIAALLIILSIYNFTSSGKKDIPSKSDTLKMQLLINKMPTNK